MLRLGGDVLASFLIALTAASFGDADQKAKSSPKEPAPFVFEADAKGQWSFKDGVLHITHGPGCLRTRQVHNDCSGGGSPTVVSTAGRFASERSWT
jgi:hypothetical protein